MKLVKYAAIEEANKRAYEQLFGKSMKIENSKDLHVLHGVEDNKPQAKHDTMTESQQTKWDRRWLGIAAEISRFSKDPSTQVGAVIVDCENRLISTGYNGFPRFMDDKPEYYNDRSEKYSRIVHGEINAILFSRGANLDCCTLYTFPFIPCDRCVVIVGQTGIYRIVSITPTLEQVERWGSAFERTRQYCNEMMIDLKEY